MLLDNIVRRTEAYNQYSIGKRIVFKAADTISSVEVECKLKNRNVRKKVVTSSDWESYSISLFELEGDISEWKRN